MSQNNPINPYLKTKIMTASPEELRLMLYEGAIKFCRVARDSIDNQDFESSYTALMRSQKIVLELSTSLNHNIAPELCDKLAALYTYIYRLLVDANMKREVEPIDEAIKLLDYERETWQLLMKKTGDEDGASDSTAPKGTPGPTRLPAQPPKAAPQSTTGAQQTAISSLSING